MAKFSGHFIQFTEPELIIDAVGSMVNEFNKDKVKVKVKQIV